ncbi:pyrin-like isoform X2 [Zootoca vivipara]|uniref:pyrin-like isoform X2 n=1 Tax=Zootoca vivipara TaxID=8524 RepID=UPI00293BE762|nr:pyrin-like isoform X2 [Zootoca vivipara]
MADAPRDTDKVLSFARPVRRALPSHTILLNTLKILKESELKKFKGKLYHFSIKKGFVNILKELMEEASVSDLSQLLLVYYGLDYALEVMARVLEAIDCEPQADREDDLVMPTDVDRMQREVGKEKVWPLEGVAISAKKIICKGRK